MTYQNKYPVVLLHGMFGFGQQQITNDVLPYFSSRKHVEENEELEESEENFHPSKNHKISHFQRKVLLLYPYKT